MNALHNVFHCKTRRNVYGALAALAGLSLGLAGLTLRPAAATADETQPIRQNTPAPELTGANWVNTPRSAPIRLASRAGKVTLLHFWTFGCINCKHNLPSYARLQKQFASQDVAIIGVHTPETSEEGVASNVRARVREYGITYPILIDANHANWNRWNQQFWPTIYLIDKHGRVRYRWEGELEYDNQDGTRKIANAVKELLAEK